MAISLFDTRSMLEILEIKKEPKTFLLNTFFKDVKTFDTPYIDIDIKKHGRRIAVYVNPNSEGNVLERTGYSTYTYQPPYLKPKMVTTAGDLLKRMPGEILYANSESPAQKSAKLLADDLMELSDAITRAEEIQAKQALFDAQVQVLDASGEAVQDTITFPRESTHSIDLSASGETPWDNAGADILQDMRDWKQLVVKDAGVSVDIGIVSSTVTKYILANTSVKSYLDLRRYELGNIEMREQEMHLRYIGILEGIPLWEYLEWYTDPATGTLTSMVPDNYVLLGSTKAECTRCYGAIQDMDESGVGIASVARFPKTWTVPDPSARFLQVHSAPLMIPKRVDGFVSAKVF